ncbi:LAME_0G01200g1_1 [Lachancea meyersii CBS 8951]|uniref:LAME_0G01200g1_1 n=1 Tax=Lachancea meyersii CBS 8951 TaxID=1266667 RepID=A0A1G4K5E9_9SACH|nr:LAME_0G01200g1_1 [Lachancea meyersii CBS 8951]
MSIVTSEIPEEPKVEDISLWGVEEVLIWLEQTLCISGPEDSEIDTEGASVHPSSRDKVRENFRENSIDGSAILELDLDDCKQLLNSDAKLAVQLKLEVNRLKNQKRSQEDEILAVLSQLYSTVSDKLQDFQSQYSRLRLDVLEVVKRDPVSLPQSQNVSTGSASSSHGHAPQHDYFEGHRVVMPSSPNTPAVRQPLNRSTSGSVFHPNPSASTVSTPYSVPTSQPAAGVGNEPLKHMRASKEDSCERILKSAMKRHGLSEQDWRQYVLVICYGDQERILELDEKPVQIFKNLKQQGLHPAIMLRQRGDFEEVSNGLTPGGRL